MATRASTGTPREETREPITRRRFLAAAGSLAGSAAAAAFATPTPQVVTATVAKQPDPMQATTYDEWMTAKGVSDESFSLRVLSPFDPAISDVNQRHVDNIFGEFKKLYPNAQIEYEVAGWGEIDAKTIAYGLAGTPLDVAYNWNGAVATFAAQGIVQPVQSLMPQWWLDSRIDGLLEPSANGMWNGDLYFAYEIWLPMSLIARRDLLEEAEVAPESIQTQEDFLAALQAIAAKTDMKQPLAFMLGESYAAMDHSIHWFNSNGLDSMADFSNRDAWIDTVRFIQELFTYVPEAALGWAYPEAERAYATGAIGSLVHGSWLIASREFDTAGIFTTERTVPLPTPFGPHASEESPFYVPAENGYFLDSQSQQSQAAIDFVCVATATKTLLATRGTDLPATDDWDAQSLMAARPDQEDIVWWYDLWREIGQTYRTFTAPGMVARSELEQRWYELLIDLWNGNTTPETMYDDFEGFAVPIIEEVTEAT